MMPAASAGVTPGYRARMTPTARAPPMTSAAMKPGTEDGAIPAKVSENIRPAAMAGLAKLVEDVKKYAAPIYAPTAAGAALDRPDRASAKMTRMRPRVAMISDRKCAGEARCLAEMLTAARENSRFATRSPPMQRVACAGRKAGAPRQRSPPKAASTNET